MTECFYLIKSCLINWKQLLFYLFLLLSGKYQWPPYGNQSGQQNKIMLFSGFNTFIFWICIPWSTFILWVYDDPANNITTMFSMLGKEGIVCVPSNVSSFARTFGQQICHIIIHQTHCEKSDWSRAFSQFTIACELNMINTISAADIAFIMSSSTSAWLLRASLHDPGLLFSPGWITAAGNPFAVKCL